MPIMMRRAEDDFAALKTGDAMERAGASVFAITPNGTATFVGALAPHTKYIVWAKVQDDAHIGRVDAEIEKEFGDD